MCEPGVWIAVVTVPRVFAHGRVLLGGTLKIDELHLQPYGIATLLIVGIAAGVMIRAMNCDSTFQSPMLPPHRAAQCRVINCEGNIKVPVR